MKITAKQEFTITFTGEELLKLKKYLGSGHQYHSDCAYDLENDEKGDKETKLAKQHRAAAEDIMEIVTQLPNPFGSL